MKKILILIFCLFFLTGCTLNSDNNSNKDKMISEIKYIGTQLGDILHDLNNLSLENYELVTENIKMNNEESSGSSNGSQASSGQSSSSSSSKSEQESSEISKENYISETEMEKNNILDINNEAIDWKTIKEKIETLNISWSIVMIDLGNNNVSEDNLVAFTTTLNKTIIDIKNENKENSLNNIINLYSYIPSFLSEISADNYTQNIEKTKHQLLTAYSAASQEDWNTVDLKISEAQNTFLNILNEEEYIENYKLKKITTLLNDIQYSIPNNDKELFFLKYKNLIQTLNIL